MKLRNKITGEIIDIYKSDIIVHYDQGRRTIHFKNLEDLEEWEDYEEPKDHWHIGCEGDVFIDNTESCLKIYSLIGNDFATKEDAEKAVEKLKAWKRLKDKGLYFVRDAINEGEYEHNFVLRPMMDKDKRYVPMHDAKEIYNDIKLIFDLNIKEVKNE